MFTRASATWPGISQYIGQVTLVDGRAKTGDVFQVLDHLTPSKLRIIVNHGDFLRPLTPSLSCL
jgi:hypothetical protein